MYENKNTFKHKSTVNHMKINIFINVLLTIIFPSIFFVTLSILINDTVDHTTYSLLLTNIAIVPSMMFTFHYKYYIEFVLTNPILYISSLYHICDNNKGKYAICDSNYKSLHYSDHVVSYLLIVTYMVYKMNFASVIKVMINLLYCILFGMSLYTEENATNANFVFTIIIAFSIIPIMIARYVYMHCHKDDNIAYHSILESFKSPYMIIGIIIAVVATIFLALWEVLWSSVWGIDSYWWVHSYLWHIPIMFSTFLLLKSTPETDLTQNVKEMACLNLPL